MSDVVDVAAAAAAAAADDDDDKSVWEVDGRLIVALRLDNLAGLQLLRHRSANTPMTTERYSHQIGVACTLSIAYSFVHS